MKKIAIYCIGFFVAVCSCSVNAEQVSEIELIDGAVVFGRIVSLQDGQYVIQTNTLGTVNIDEEKIRVIRIKHGPSQMNDPATPPGKPYSEEVQSLQKSIMENEVIMQKILALQNDPRMQEILQDPEIMKALDSGNFAALLSNPTFLEMMNSPELLEIQREILSPKTGGR